MKGSVVSVNRSGTHSFSKRPAEEVVIVAGLGIQGDAHAGTKVKHRYLVRKDPNAANLAQVHLIGCELFQDLKVQGMDISPGEMGENVTTSGLELLGLPLGAKLHMGATAVVQVTGLRTPCVQMDRFRPGLMKACTGRDLDGGKVLKAGVMAIALVGGVVRPGDVIEVETPAGEWRRLGPV